MHIAVMHFSNNSTVVLWVISFSTETAIYFLDKIYSTLFITVKIFPNDMVRENYSIKRIYSLTAGSTNIEFKFELKGKRHAIWYWDIL